MSKALTAGTDAIGETVYQGSGDGTSNRESRRKTVTVLVTGWCITVDRCAQ